VVSIRISGFFCLYRIFTIAIDLFWPGCNGKIVRFGRKRTLKALRAGHYSRPPVASLFILTPRATLDNELGE